MAKDNFAKHGVHFAETAPVFEDDYAIVIMDNARIREKPDLWPWEQVL